MHGVSWVYSSAGPILSTLSFCLHFNVFFRERVPFFTSFSARNCMKEWLDSRKLHLLDRVRLGDLKGFFKTFFWHLYLCV